MVAVALTLDVGCGKHVTHIARGTVNVDINSQPVHRPDNFICADAHHLPFQNDVFDTAIFYEVIEHVENPHQCLQEIRRVLKLDGTMHVSTPNPTQWRRLLRHLLGRSLQVYPEHVSLWGVAELSNLLDVCGFNVKHHSCIQFPEREKYDHWRHRYIDRFLYLLRVWRVFTGRSVHITASPKPYVN